MTDRETNDAETEIKDLFLNLHREAKFWRTEFERMKRENEQLQLNIDNAKTFLDWKRPGKPPESVW